MITEPNWSRAAILVLPPGFVALLVALCSRLGLRLWAFLPLWTIATGTLGS